MSEYLERFIELAERKNTEAAIFNFPHTGTWRVQIKCSHEGTVLEITNKEHTDFVGAVAEVIEKFEAFAPRTMTAPQIEHKPTFTPTPRVNLDDEIPF